MLMPPPSCPVAPGPPQNRHNDKRPAADRTRNFLSLMPGSTGLEPATSGLTERGDISEVASLQSRISIGSRTCVSLRWLGSSLDLLLRAVRSSRFCHVFSGLRRSRFRKPNGASSAPGAPAPSSLFILCFVRRLRCWRRTEASCRPPPYVHDSQSSSRTRRVGIEGAPGGTMPRAPSSC
jgi:hypothetical protein